MQQSNQLAADSDLVAPSQVLAGLHLRTRCLPDLNCTQMGPHATLADTSSTVTVRGIRVPIIMTGMRFWGCKCCGTYGRHNEVVQVAFAYFKCESRFSGSASSVDSNLVMPVGISAKGKRRHTDGQVWGSPLFSKRVAFDVSILVADPNAVSHSLRSRCRSVHACGESFLDHFPNAGTRSAEKTNLKADKYKFLRQQLGIDFVTVPIIFTASGGMGGAVPEYWNPHWNDRVEEEDEQMKIGPWVQVARKRRALWQARFTVTVAVANCNLNARMISHTQWPHSAYITD
jgi:hypothetical protein